MRLFFSVTKASLQGVRNQHVDHEEDLTSGIASKQSLLESPLKCLWPTFLESMSACHEMVKKRNYGDRGCRIP